MNNNKRVTIGKLENNVNPVQARQRLYAWAMFYLPILAASCITIHQFNCFLGSSINVQQDYPFLPKCTLFYLSEISPGIWPNTKSLTSDNCYQNINFQGDGSEYYWTWKLYYPFKLGESDQVSWKVSQTKGAFKYYILRFCWESNI